MRLLVTGGAGFIGTNFVRWVRQFQPEVVITVLDAYTYAAQGMNLEVDGWLTDQDGSVRVVRGDIRDTELVRDLVRVHDAVVHFAAESHNDLSLDRPLEFVDVNVRGTGVLLEAVRAHRVRFHHVSTDEVFGDLTLNDPPFTRLSPYRPSSPYSSSKASADHLVRAWVRSYGVNATISICSNNYGPFQHVEKFIPRQITELLEGRPPRIYGSGRNVRDWIHVDDHSAGVWAALTGGAMGQTYLLGARSEFSNLEIVHTLLDIFGRPRTDLLQVADRAGHDLRYAIDPSDTEGELGWRATSRLMYDELERLVHWYDSQQGWWMPLKQATEDRYLARGQ